MLCVCECVCVRISSLTLPLTPLSLSYNQHQAHLASSCVLSPPFLSGAGLDPLEEEVGSLTDWESCHLQGGHASACVCVCACVSVYK